MLTVLLVFFASCGGLSSRSHSPLVFSINLSSKVAQIQLSESSQPVFVVKDLQPFETRQLTRVGVSKGVVLSTSLGSNPARVEWKDPSGSPYNLRLEEGKTYCIVVDPLGKASMVYLPESYTSEPKIAIVNGTSDTLAQVQLAPDFNKNVKVYVQDLPPNQPTEFFSIKPKTLAFFWQTVGQTFTSDFFRIESKDGESLQKQFEENRFYFILAANGVPGEEIHGKIWDITPQDE